MSMQNGHLVIATGGTGGHFYPGLAVARAFQKQGGTVTLFVAGQRTETHIKEARQEGIVAFACPAFRLPRSPLSALTFLPRIVYGVMKARSMLKNLDVDFVLGMGSFASFPPCMSAVFARIPLFLHDGNAVIGQANRFLSRWATCLGLSLPLAPGITARCKTKVTGMPVRNRILQAIAVPPDREALLKEMNLENQRKTVLIFGGSQGAECINHLIRGGIAALADLPIQVIHLTGQTDNTAVEDAYRQAGIPVVVRTFDAKMEKLYSVADLAVCRSGGGTLAELALFGIPPILLPIPKASLNHQCLNAEVLKQADAAVVLDQATATPDELAKTIRSFFESGDPWKQRGKNIRKFSHPRSASAIVDMIFVEAGH